MKSRTICWRCVSPCIVRKRYLNTCSSVKNRGKGWGEAGDSKGDERARVPYGPRAQSRVRLGLPHRKQLHFHVDMARLAVRPLRVEAGESRDEVVVHPL